MLPPRDPGPPACRNAARATFGDALGALLVAQGLDRLDQDLADLLELAELLRGLDLPEIEPAGAAEMSAQLRAELRDNLRSAPAFHETVEQLWLLLTPEQVLSKLYAAPQPLAAAGDGTDLSGLHRDARSPWTVADAPLLDELAELLRPPPGTPVRASDSDIVDERA